VTVLGESLEYPVIPSYHRIMGKSTVGALIYKLDKFFVFLN
jgi:hypothetical protein